MSTKFRPDISKKNKYWISKHRYYELKHFCLQYPEWKEEYKHLSYIYGIDVADGTSKDGMRAEHVSDKADILSKISSKIRLVEDCCYETDPELYEYLMMAVTDGKSYTNLRTVYDIPCSRSSFYGRYRKFFFILSQKIHPL